MQANAVKESYARSPNIWNLSLIMSIGTLLWGMLAFFINGQFESHSISETAHPPMTAQLNRMEANQIATRIEAMSERVCLDPINSFYRSELRKLITEWEKLTDERYPTQLLRCANGSA